MPPPKWGAGGGGSGKRAQLTVIIIYIGTKRRKRNFRHSWPSANMSMMHACPPHADGMMQCTTGQSGVKGHGVNILNTNTFGAFTRWWLVWQWPRFGFMRATCTRFCNRSDVPP